MLMNKKGRKDIRRREKTKVSWYNKKGKKKEMEMETEKEWIIFMGRTAYSRWQWVNPHGYG
jgi:hypothetical protein